MTNLRLSEIGELTLVETIRKRFSKKSKDIIIGIGDDAAAIKCPNKNLLITTDMMVERVHFDLSYVSPYQLGYKLVSINVSDIYAMGGTPQSLLLDIAMNKNVEKIFMDRFFNGIHDSMKLYGVALIGGDISSSKKDMVVAASLIGHSEKPIRRSGARPGDKIYVTGNLGDSACGLEVLKRIRKIVSIENTPSLTLPPRGGGMGGGGNSEFKTLNSKLSKLGLTWNTVEPLVRRHLMPEARNPVSFTRYSTAMIDVSDGLFIDLSRLCDESRVGVRIYMEHIPVSSSMKKAASVLGLDSFKLAAAGGEDYELLFTLPDSKLKTQNSKLKITCIGEITKKDRTIVDKKGKETELKAMGYQHFAARGSIR
ncbi:MAG: thiamine-monophosphate kinase [Nitrospirae bacterium]|nr:thiamine-monophosphate kinase [Nitrospirota bacterium]